MGLKVATREYGQWVVVVFDGDADLHTNNQVTTALNQAMAVAPCLIIDCSALTFCDSTFLSTLVNAYKQAQAHGGTVALAAPTRTFELLLDRTRLNQIFPIYRTVAEAAV